MLRLLDGIEKPESKSGGHLVAGIQNGGIPMPASPRKLIGFPLIHCDHPLYLSSIINRQRFINTAQVMIAVEAMAPLLTRFDSRITLAGPIPYS